MHSLWSVSSAEVCPLPAAETSWALLCRRASVAGYPGGFDAPPSLQPNDPSWRQPGGTPRHFRCRLRHTCLCYAMACNMSSPQWAPAIQAQCSLTHCCWTLCRQSTGTFWPAPLLGGQEEQMQHASDGFLQEGSVLLFPERASWDQTAGEGPGSPLSF